MKKLLFVSSAVVLVLLVSVITAALAQEDPTNKFLAEKYGWYFGLKQNWQGKWNIACLPETIIVPERERKIGFNFVCRQEDDNAWTSIVWRLPFIAPETVEKSALDAMNGNHKGYEYKFECVPDTNVHGGVIDDCVIHLDQRLRKDRRTEFFISFFHFETKIPKPYTIEIKGEVKESNLLAFTIFVKNYKGGNEQVREKLRELVSTIKFTGLD